MQATFNPSPRDIVRFHHSYILEPETGCWIWTKYVNDAGYGIFYWGRGEGKRRCRAHRAAYEMLVESIAEGLVLDHLCRNRACVNPGHLDAVTHQVNIARGQAGQHVTERALTQTSCLNGHAYTEENTYRDRTGRRSCLTCTRKRQGRDETCPNCGSIRAYRTVLQHLKQGCPDLSDHRARRTAERLAAGRANRRTDPDDDR